MKVLKNIDLDKIDLDFSIYKKDIVENTCRIDYIKEKFEKKIIMVSSFQKGKNIWVNFT